MTSRWYENGIRFECSGCGQCCKSHGEHDENKFVYLSYKDKLAISTHLKLPMDVFFFRHCTHQDGYTVLKRENNGCSFLNKNGCTIYHARPKQCSTWPFWTENLVQDVWMGPVQSCCPGIGQGKLYTADEIDRIARIRDQWCGIERSSTPTQPAYLQQ